jgi:hypothetical protein
MSFDIDMQNYAGELSNPAAGDSPVDTNLYQEVEEFPVQKDLLDQPPQDDPIHKAPEVNPQAEHFRALREEVDRIKAEKEAEKREYQAQLDMLRANLNQVNSQRQPEPQSKKMFEGMDETDVPNVRELRNEWEQREAGYQSRIEELQVAQMHPDYAEVIEKFALPLVQQKPHLAEGIQGARNKALFAYELGKMAQQMQMAQAPAAPQVSENAQRIVENSKKPGTLSQAGGQGALSKADYFATMSDQEFMKFASRNLEGI